jgi:hypothetical protein
MALTNTEFEAILEDPSKRIDRDISWQEDEDHSPSVEFRAEIQSEAGWPLFVRGSYNPLCKRRSENAAGGGAKVRHHGDSGVILLSVSVKGSGPGGEEALGPTRPPASERSGLAPASL